MLKNLNIVSYGIFCQTNYLDGFLKGDKFSSMTCEYLSYLEGLWQEPLDLTGSRYSQLVFFWQLIHTQDSNDVLQWLVVLLTN